MKALLDTHTFLWWITDDSHLSETAAAIISNGDNDIFLSAASGWEMAIKARLGKLELPPNIEHFVAEQLAINNFTALPIQMTHALHVYSLPDYHKDPFDRLLLAQAQLEELTIITTNSLIAQYSIKVIW